MWDDELAAGGMAVLLPSLREAREASDDPDGVTVEGIGRGASAALALVAHQRRLGIGVGRVVLRDLDPGADDPISGGPMPAPPARLGETEIVVHCDADDPAAEVADRWREAGWPVTVVPVRERRDLCPGVFRPWAAADGAIVRLRTPGGRIATAALVGLHEVASAHGDGSLLVTRRANVQVRGIDAPDGNVPAHVVAAIRATGLLPSDTHELVRNIVASPFTGRAGGRADLRPVVADLDERLCAELALSDLGGRFLFVLDDGRGDVADRPLDLGLTAVDATHAQLRLGAHGWGQVVSLADAGAALVALAQQFARVRGTGPGAAWHVDELAGAGADLAPVTARDPRTEVRTDAPEPGRHLQDDGRVAEVIALPDGLVTTVVLDRLIASGAPEVVLTPWRTVVVPDLENS